ncbi:hypothetical protein HDU96_003542 [Phlyctochytrium bullatum]|nr:hypothetical protein HDU96_003542 [Phlyctochytrium bullatum]
MLLAIVMLFSGLRVCKMRHDLAAVQPTGAKTKRSVGLGLPSPGQLSETEHFQMLIFGSAVCSWVSLVYMDARGPSSLVLEAFNAGRMAFASAGGLTLCDIILNMNFIVPNLPIHKFSQHYRKPAFRVLLGIVGVGLICDVAKGALQDMYLRTQSTHPYLVAAQITGQTFFILFFIAIFGLAVQCSVSGLLFRTSIKECEASIRVIEESLTTRGTGGMRSGATGTEGGGVWSLRSGVEGKSPTMMEANPTETLSSSKDPSNLPKSPLNNASETELSSDLESLVSSESLAASTQSGRSAKKDLLRIHLSRKITLGKLGKVPMTEATTDAGVAPRGTPSLVVPGKKTQPDDTLKNPYESKSTLSSKGSQDHIHLDTKAGTKALLTVKLNKDIFSKIAPRHDTSERKRKTKEREKAEMAIAALTSAMWAVLIMSGGCVFILIYYISLWAFMLRRNDVTSVYVTAFLGDWCSGPTVGIPPVFIIIMMNWRKHTQLVRARKEAEIKADAVR